MKYELYLKLDKNNKFISNDQEHNCKLDGKKVENLFFLEDKKPF